MADISPPRAGYERGDVSPGFVGVLAAGFAGTVVLVVIVLLLLFPSAAGDRSAPTPPAIPAPRLQPDPAADLAAYQARMTARRDSYGWTDRGAGLVHIPVEAALGELAARGWPEGKHE